MYYIAHYDNEYGLSIGRVDNKDKTVTDKYPVGKVGHPFLDKLSKYQYNKLMSGRTIIINKNNNIVKELYK